MENVPLTEPSSSVPPSVPLSVPPLVPVPPVAPSRASNVRKPYAKAKQQFFSALQLL